MASNGWSGTGSPAVGPRADHVSPMGVPSVRLPAERRVAWADVAGKGRPPQRGCCMTLGSTRIGAAIERRLHTPVGKRFSRFILVAAGAVIASQVTLAVCLGPIGWTAGRSALTAWLVGAAVSYVL